MKLRTVAVLSFAGMLLSSATVYSLTPGPRAVAPPAVPESLPQAGPSPDPLGSSFDVGTTLKVGGRMGHPKILQGARGETFVLLEVGAADAEGAAAVGSSALAIVIDRSGSMKGDRIRNAIAGAVEAVDRLGDGDIVSVAAFDTTVSTIVPPTVLDAGNRARVRAEIGKITVGGDTCISCGMEDAMAKLRTMTGRTERMILLSDGEATAGVRDLDGFRAIAERARRDGISVTTIGVGVSYNQKVLGGIALQGGGDHYFIEDTTSLQRVFQAEADKVRATVAREAKATIDLAPGVELVSVVDRTFDRAGQRVTVSLGSFARREEKSVLLRVRVPTDLAARTPVADVSLDFADLVRGAPGHCEGRLEVDVGAEQSDVDGVVGGRVERSRTAATLLEVNDLIERGKLDEAKSRLAAQKNELAASAASARNAAPMKRAADVDNDFKNQASSISRAEKVLAAPAPAAAPRAARGNQQDANQFFR